MSDIFSGLDLTYSAQLAAARAATAAKQTTGSGSTSATIPIGSVEKPKNARDPKTDLGFMDMLQLMIVQLQNQTIDNQADTNDMMNQMIQMTVMQAITSMSTQVETLTESMTNLNTMTYAASLVGKEVTVGIIEGTGADAKLKEITGKVTATGYYDGEPIIFLDDDKSYLLSSIMTVGKLPDKGETKPPEGSGDSGTDAGDNGSTEEADPA